MMPFPTYRAAHLLAYIDVLEEIGAPVESGLRQARLPTMLAERPDTALPVRQTLDFLTAITRKQGIDELGLRATRRIRVADLSATVAAGVWSASTLQLGLKMFCALAPEFEDTSTAFWIATGRTASKVCSRVEAACDPRGLRYSEWGQNMALLAIVRAFAGRSWAPSEMAFASQGPVSRYAFEQFPNTRFLAGQKAAWITVPRQLLILSAPARAPVSGIEAASGADATCGAELPCDAPGTLRRVLASYLGEGCPPIDFAAELAGVSVRTLQRRLRGHGLSYLGLVQQTRFDVAAGLLRGSDTKMIEIAYEAGYEDPSHFSRAFRRMAGCSPREYRRRHGLDAGRNRLAA